MAHWLCRKKGLGKQMWVAFLRKKGRKRHGVAILDFCILNRTAVEAQMDAPRGKPKGPHMKEVHRLEQELVNGSMTLKAKNGAVKVVTAKELGGRAVPEAAGQGVAALENVYGARATGTGYVAAPTVDDFIGEYASNEEYRRRASALV